MNIKNNTKNYLNDSSNFRSSTNGNGRRKLSSDVLDKSVISPFYTEKPSFSFDMSTDLNNSQLISMRVNSANKYKTRIRKEIDLLSKSFKEGIVPSTTFNRPIAQVNKPEYSNFSINYLTTIAGLKERTKENKKKTKDNRTKAFSFLYETKNSFGKPKNDASSYLNYFGQKKSNGNNKDVSKAIYNILINRK